MCPDHRWHTTEDRGHVGGGHGGVGAVAVAGGVWLGNGEVRVREDWYEEWLRRLEL